VQTAGGVKEFSLIKVPHHGSGASHAPQICKMWRQGSEAIAAISVGTRFRKLPDRKVMQDFLRNGWIVMLTTKRRTSSRTHAIQLFGKS
jgi:beta-lactamase superfamily II metal-dependent hydrolase